LRTGIPPEVLIALAAGLAHGFAEDAGKVLWAKLKQFLEDYSDLPPSRLITLNLKGSEIAFRRRDLPDQLPQEYWESVFADAESRDANA
jgi:hypothetical protein